MKINMCLAMVALMLGCGGIGGSGGAGPVMSTSPDDRNIPPNSTWFCALPFEQCWPSLTMCSNASPTVERCIPSGRMPVYCFSVTSTNPEDTMLYMCFLSQNTCNDFIIRMDEHPGLTSISSCGAIVTRS